MTKNILYLLVTDEPYLSACKDWRRRFDEGAKASYEFALSLGASGYFPGNDHELVGLTMTDPIPDGWMAVKKKSMLVPMKGNAGRQARDAIARLPAMPKSSEIAELIGHPCQISYQSSEDDPEAWGTCGLGYTSPVALVWAGSKFLIQAVDMAKVIQGYRDEYPDLVVNIGHWIPPASLRSISKAKWHLMEAESLDELDELVYLNLERPILNYRRP